MAGDDEPSPATRWQQRIAGHAVSQRLPQLRAAIERIEARPDADGAIEILNRLWYVTGRAERALREADPESVTQNNLNNLNNGVNAAVSGIETQEAQEAAEPAVPFNWDGLEIDAVLDGLSGWPPVSDAEDEVIRDLSQKIEEARTLAAGMITSVRDQATAAAEEVQAKLTALDQQSAEAVSGLAAKQSDLDTRIAQQVELVGQQLPRLDAAITTQTEGFNTSEIERRNQATAALDEALNQQNQVLADFRTAEEGLRSTAKAQRDALIAELKTGGEATQKSLDDLLVQAREIVGVIARTGMTGGYQQYADRERGDADRWRKVALVLGVFTVAVLGGVVVWSGLDHNTSWPLALGRLLLAAGLGGVSAYAAREASQHRKRADHARQLELALASIGPYLEAVDPTVREKVLETFAYVFFTAREADSEPDGEAGPSLLAAAVSAVAQGLVK